VNETLYKAVFEPPWGWFRTIVHELHVLRRNEWLPPTNTGLPEPTIEEIIWFSFGLTSILWIVLGRPTDELFCARFLRGELRLR
jgi:hypothetical protein